jgi:hypothetical protein
VSELNPEQQDALLQDIVVVLSHSLPPGWQACLAEHRALGGYAETTLRIERLNGPPTDVDFPPALPELFGRLRAGMGQPGVGAWFTARLQLDFPARYQVAYDIDGQPAWSSPPPADAYDEELRRFPRDPEHTPDWLGEPAGVAAGDTGDMNDTNADTTPNAPGDTSAEAAPSFRTARLFDSMGSGNSPQVDRPPVPEEEMEALVGYLTKAPIVLAARTLDTDLIDPAHPAKVPLSYLTDGTWIWPGGVGYYLSTHGVPPEPELVDHIRSRSFHPPEVDDYTREAAAASVMGAPPPSRPRPAPSETEPAVPAPPEVAPAESAPPESAPPESAPPESAPPEAAPPEAAPPEAAQSVRSEPMVEEVEEAAQPVPAEPVQPDPDGSPAAAEADEENERLALEQLRTRLTDLGADPRAYSLDSIADDAWCMVREDEGWAVFRSEREGRGMEATFPDIDRAAAYLLGTILFVPSRMNPFGAPPADPVIEPVTRPDVSAPPSDAGPPPRTYEGPIEPLEGEPPLTLFRNLRELELAAGTEIDRFGELGGNLAYAAGTHYTLRSLPPEWSDRPYHLYRLQQPLRVLIGTAVPWFDQPGGGTGCYLPVSIADLLADGVLMELEPPA